MGMYLNPGNQLFQESLNSEIYVDKSSMIAYTNKILGTRQKFVCISRPRRFGKTMTGDMLVAYYQRGIDSRGQFRGLRAELLPSFEEHLNRYNVIHLNIQNFLSGSKDIDGMLAHLDESLIFDIGAGYPEVTMPPGRDVATVLSAVAMQTGTPFVFIIDEWDCVFRIHKDDADAQSRYLDWLRALLKDRPYVALAYMTGILPIKKYGQHSALNMFTEVSMTNAWPIAAETGFTEDEMRVLCERYGRSIDDMRRWYDGYLVNGIEIYNPRSAVMASMSGIYDSYWTQTETFEALRVYIEMDFDGLRGKVVQLIGGGKVDVNVSKFQNDMTSLQTADDVLTLLVHLGYLTYDLESKQVWMPNGEVAGEFMNCIEDRGWEEVMHAVRASADLLEATFAGDAEAVAQGIERAHEDNSSILKYNDENSLACVVSLAYYAARKTHIVRREMAAGKGFADLVFEPRPGVRRPGLVVELKRGAGAGKAIEQIRERGYARALEGLADEVLLVGIAYDPEGKRHECMIEKARHGTQSGGWENA